MPTKTFWSSSIACGAKRIAVTVFDLMIVWYTAAAKRMAFMSATHRIRPEEKRYVQALLGVGETYMRHQGLTNGA